MRAEAPGANWRAFQLTAEEAKEAPDVIVGTFLVNSMPALVLFYSRASHSFVSLRLSKNFNHAIGNLDHPLRVEIVDDRMINALKFYRTCTLEISNASFLMNLIPIPMQEMSVIVGLDLLNEFEALIDCRHKRVRVQTPSRGELTI